MKKLLTTTAVIAFVAAAPVTAEMAKFNVEMTGEELSASELIGMRIYANETEDVPATGNSEDWTDVGEIHDILVSADGNVKAVLVDIGGFLGLGERQVSLDMSSLNKVEVEDSEDFFFVINATQEDLENAPVYEGEDMAAMDGDMNNDTDTMAQETDEAVAEAEETGDAMANDAEEVVAEAEEGAEAMANETEEVVAEAEEGAETMAAETEDAVADAAESTEAAVDETVAEVDADATPAMPGTRISPEGYEIAISDDLTTEELTGTRVYDANDEWIGEISQITVTDSGELDQFVIDVGGFLGIGEKPVALDKDDLEIVRENGTSALRVYTSNTEAELEAMPTYEN